ncbi:TPA: DUF3563 family protein [Burkholderia cenocepacia]|uniref:DUF3563 family protein n=1 Tax=unclassified Burkholderia TaxID=2613784 RepID=UPI001588DFE4|nr:MULTISPECIES: DUF3563 family protein [unclassified Burkholderia]HEF5875093.1 DUF3563 family protein [Burkholderia cenocepacia]
MINRSLARLLAQLLDQETRRRDAYLSGASNLAELERRMRHFESNHAQYFLRSGDRQRDGKD